MHTHARTGEIDVLWFTTLGRAYDRESESEQEHLPGSQASSWRLAPSVAS